MMKLTTIALLAAVGATAAMAQTPAAISPAMKALVDRQFAAIDADRNGTISRAEFGRYAAARIARQDGEFDIAFRSLDADGDGKVSKTEARANPPLAQHFGDVDTNNDQSISRAELHAAMVAAQSMDLSGN